MVFAKTGNPLKAASISAAAQRAPKRLVHDGIIDAGSLRDAIASASSGDTINFSLTYPATITLGSTLTITGSTSLTISGPGASNLAVSGNHSVQVVSIGPAGTSGGVPTVSISGLTIENGNGSSSFSGSGGGIENDFGTLTVLACTLSGNTALGGGAIFINGGTVTVSGSLLSGNSAPGFTGAGGGIFNSGGTLTVANSTLSGNSAGGNSSLGGGGIFNNGGTLTVTNSTLSGNSAAGSGGGIYNSSGAASTMKSTIVANNPSGGNCFGTFASAGYNLSDDASCNFSGPGDTNSAAAHLDPSGLKNNGGATQTIALLGNSPAVHAIPIAACTDANSNPVSTDQRGVARPTRPWLLRHRGV